MTSVFIALMHADLRCIALATNLFETSMLAFSRFLAFGAVIFYAIMYADLAFLAKCLHAVVLAVLIPIALCVVQQGSA